MKFHALPPIRYKISVVEGFVHRFHRACSSWENFHDTMEKVKMTLQRNQYPPNFCDPIISNTIEKRLFPKENQKDQIKDVTSQKSNTVKQNAFIEYRGSVTDHFIKELKNIGTPLQPGIILHKMRTCLSSLKCTIKKNLKSHVVYKIACPGCKACYVGQTSRHLIAQSSEHKYKRNQPVRAHFNTCTGDAPTVDDVKILASKSRGLDYLVTLEALYIRKIKSELNTKMSTAAGN